MVASGGGHADGVGDQRCFGRSWWGGRREPPMDRPSPRAALARARIAPELHQAFILPNKIKGFMIRFLFYGRNEAILFSGLVLHEWATLACHEIVPQG